MGHNTSDGYTWTSASGVVPGLESEAYVSPQRSGARESHTYDVIVVGAGYAGLAAARDLATSNHSVLLLEARDRFGGRTYTAKKDGKSPQAMKSCSDASTDAKIPPHSGFLYEMGGTWVTHHMGYLFREMVRYKMDRNLITTGSPNMENGYYTINVPGAKPRRTTHEEAGAIMASAWAIFVDVDGQKGRTVCPLPHAQLDNVVVDRATVEKLDKVSCQERFDQISHLLTAEQQGILISLLLHISGGTMENSSAWDMVRSHALLMHSSDNFTDVWLRYKLRDGQTELAKRILNEAVETGLDYAFSTPIQSISEADKGSSNTAAAVQVKTAGDETFRAHKVICTIPLNVLKDIQFNPPLSALRQEAIHTGHVNQMTKIHADIKNKGLERWNGMRYPGLLMYGYADGVLPNGNVHIVAFGADERHRFVTERDPESALAALQKLHPMNIDNMTFHNWASDQYSQGGPAWWRPGYMSKYQDELQSRHGNVFFASADWAHGWRASIDGALEQGVQSAYTAAVELRGLKRQVSSRL